MEVKHQVFVSSTYRDLIDERKAVIHALLELDCIPAGMELFPAADEDAWTLIREVIDDCDYYILIIAGKYGSMNHEGVSYTEMEFDYAINMNKPIIVFLHEDIENLSVSNTEKTEILQKKLRDFREKAQVKHCKFWNSPEDLGGKVSRSLIQLKKRHPSSGWVPGRYAATDVMLRELHDLKAKVAQYEIDALLGTSVAPSGSDQLAQGTDLVSLQKTLILDDDGNVKSTHLKVSWDKLFSYCGPSMMSECKDSEIFQRIKLVYYHEIPEALRVFNPLKSMILPYVFEDKIRVQLQALGLIAPGIKKRAVSDGSSYWRLTPHGEKYLLGIKAVKRKTVTS